MPSTLQIVLNLSSNHFSGPIPRTLDAGNKDLICNNASSNTFSRSAKKGNFVFVAVLVAMVAAIFLVGQREYAYTTKVTTAGNVYSFEVILLELLTGKDAAVTNGTELNSTKQDHILDFNVSKSSQAVRNQMLAILKVALACVSTSPEASKT
ncbi:leucine-rich repeat receptor-like tyrosine-protein kinase PXC3 [Senna tora]|uniref:non-specific serine/threonine protein kinase n=1 Tax=Senna tora TaxID=362788 RepID=A0A834SZ40_9FABA|nr:leucine-rich repeat receptor-like tyrosine-protein kinase PXC3 [Senna tora]